MKKQCSKCGELKDDADFYNSCTQCKECKKQYRKQYYLTHIEEIKQYRLEHKEEIKQYYLTHIEEKKQYDKQHYLNHKEQIKQHGRQYRLNHKKEKKQRDKKYRLSHKEQIKQYRLEHKEEIKQYDKQYRQSEVGKITRKKHKAKRRNIKYIPLMNNPFPKEISVDDHHILNNFHAIDAEGSWNKMFVVPIPKITHRFVGGLSNNLNHWRHNEEWIRKLYCINIKELLEQ